jgi:hypothetical protein
MVSAVSATACVVIEEFLVDVGRGRVGANGEPSG